jgi:hypothetical protein
MAAEVLDHAFDKLGDGKDIRDLATLANVWLRLSELASKARKGVDTVRLDRAPRIMASLPAKMPS